MPHSVIERQPSPGNHSGGSQPCHALSVVRSSAGEQFGAEVQLLRCICDDLAQTRVGQRRLVRDHLVKAEPCSTSLPDLLCLVAHLAEQRINLLLVQIADIQT